MENIKAKVKKFMEERDWLTQMPGDVAKSVMIEAAELLEHFQWNNPTAEEFKKDKEKFDELSMELADVIIYLAELAIILDLNVEELVSKKLAKQALKYPAEKVKGPKGTEEYWKLKKAHRSA